MHDPQWCLFFDFHTMPACPDVGGRFDVEAFADRVKACGVDYIVFPARCNLGVAYYDTKVGIRHPSLKYDLLGRLVEACRKRGIAMSAYINVGLSHEEGLLRREWCTVTPEGYTYKPNRLDHFFRSMCYNTGYGDHLVEMVKEVAGGYPVSGLFLDCMCIAPCVGVECVRAMEKEGLDWRNEGDLRLFSDRSRVAMARRIADAARAANPELLLYFNGVSFESQQEIGNYLEIECLPTGGWGYEYLPVAVRYARTLGKPVVNMTGRFHRSWGDFGGIRTEASLEYDCLYGVANATRTTIGDHYHPRGDFNKPVFDLYERLYGRLRKLQPWLEGARAVADAAVVVPRPGFSYVDHQAYDRAQAAATGATRMLCELKIQFDVVTHAAPWTGYRLLVLPDYVEFDEETVSRVREHLRAGGAVLSSHRSGLLPDGSDYALSEWGVRFAGDDPCDPAYFVAGPALAGVVPDMPVALYDRGTALEALPGTERLAEIVKPFYNRHWDGEHGFVYLPPDAPAGRPAATAAGRVIHFSHPVFTSYRNHAQVPVREMAGALIKRLMPEPAVRVSGLPSFGRATVTEQKGRRIVHLLAYVPERRGDMEMIEEPIPVRGAETALRTDGRRYVRAYTAPGREPLDIAEKDGYAVVRVPDFDGYRMVVFEEEGADSGRPASGRGRTKERT